MKYVMITVGCVVMMYGYHKLIQFLKWLNSFENSHDPQDNW